jgi:hypothetical protein
MRSDLAQLPLTQLHTQNTQCKMCAVDTVKHWISLVNLLPKTFRSLQLSQFWTLWTYYILLNTQRFGDWIQSPFSGGTYSAVSLMSPETVTSSVYCYLSTALEPSDPRFSQRSLWRIVYAYCLLPLLAPLAFLSLRWNQYFPSKHW